MTFPPDKLVIRENLRGLFNSWLESAQPGASFSVRAVENDLQVVASFDGTLIPTDAPAAITAAGDVGRDDPSPAAIPPAAERADEPPTSSATPGRAPNPPPGGARPEVPPIATVVYSILGAANELTTGELYRLVRQWCDGWGIGWIEACEAWGHPRGIDRPMFRHILNQIAADRAIRVARSTIAATSWARVPTLPDPDLADATPTGIAPDSDGVKPVPLRLVDPPIDNDHDPVDDDVVVEDDGQAEATDEHSTTGIGSGAADTAIDNDHDPVDDDVVVEDDGLAEDDGDDDVVEDDDDVVEDDDILDLLSDGEKRTPRQIASVLGYRDGRAVLQRLRSYTRAGLLTQEANTWRRTPTTTATTGAPAALEARVVSIVNDHHLAWRFGMLAVIVKGHLTDDERAAHDTDAITAALDAAVAHGTLTRDGSYYLPPADEADEADGDDPEVA